jgi:SAM-dependent methyltransferase
MAESGSPFADAVRHYDAGRPPYAPAALDYVISTLGLTAGARVLDLGCGPGTIAIPLSRTGAEVVAVDLDASMLVEGRRLAAERGAGRVRWVRGRAEDVLADLGRFDVATLGQSLHWMDRDLVLRGLAQSLMGGGALVIFDEGRGRAPESWETLALRTAARYLGRAGRHPMKHPESAHEPSLLRSGCFCDFTVRAFAFSMRRDVASVLDLVFSSVIATRPMFGDRLPAFEAELTEALLRLDPSGIFEQRIETEVYVARRSRAAI